MEQNLKRVRNLKFISNVMRKTRRDERGKLKGKRGVEEVKEEGEKN